MKLLLLLIVEFIVGCGLIKINPDLIQDVSVVVTLTLVIGVIVKFIKSTDRCPKCKKSFAMDEVSRKVVDLRTRQERVSKSYYDPKTHLKETYYDYEERTKRVYEIKRKCKYCGYEDTITREEE